MLTNVTTAGDVLVWPTSCSHYFYLWIILTIAIILAVSLYRNDKKNNPNSDLISSLGVSAIASTVIALVGTLIKNASGIPMIQVDILLIVLAISVPILLVWFFKD